MFSLFYHIGFLLLIQKKVFNPFLITSKINNLAKGNLITCRVKLSPSGLGQGVFNLLDKV